MDFLEQFFSQLRLPEKITFFFSMAAFIISLYALYKNHLERVKISVYPSDFVGLVIQHGTEFVPKFNLMCNFVNKSAKLGTIHRMEANVTTPENTTLHFVWKLFYQYLPGGEIMTKQTDPYAIAVPSKGSSLLGIQFEGPQVNEKYSWPEGRYKFELIGWANRKHRRQRINIRTKFHIKISSEKTNQLWRWVTADDKEWKDIKDPHNAIAISIPVEEWSVT